MKIALLGNPPVITHRPDFPPIGIAYLGAIARSHGHETLLIDGALAGIDDIVAELKRFSPDLVGITCWTMDRVNVWRLCEKIKKVVPHKWLVIGGPHATLFPHQVMKRTNASAVVIGEGEETFAELVCAIDQGKEIASIPGIAIGDDEGRITKNGGRCLIEDLNSIPRPYYEGFRRFSFKRYQGFPSLPHPTASMISSRGCVYNCSYCSSVKYWGRKWRFRSADNILDEMQWLVKEMGVRSVHFFDDNFMVLKQRVFDICEGMREMGLNIKWSCSGHVKNVGSEMLREMKATGCVSIDFGVESGSNTILRNINKQQTREDIERAFRLAHEAGILPRAYLMVGNKGEDESTIDETIELVGRIKPWSSVGAALLLVLPGTPVYEDAVRDGYIDDEYWLRSDDVLYDLREHSMKELVHLRNRLMLGIANNKGGLLPKLTYHMRKIYYNYPSISFLRKFVPNALR